MQTETFKKLFVCSQSGVDLMRFCRQQYEPGFSAAVGTYEYLKTVRVLSGRGIWQISGRDYPIGAGDILLLNNTEPRALRRVDGTENLVMEYGTWLPVAMRCSCACLAVYFNRPENFSNLLPAGHPMHAELHRLFDLLAFHAERESPLREDVMTELLRTLFVTAAEAYLLEFPEISDASGKQTAADYRAIEETVRYISENPAEVLSEAALAARVYMSKNRFIRVFRTINGMSPAEYVRTLRVRRAMERIQAGAPISVAAMESGFGSLSGFYKAAAAVTGTTPGKYNEN